MLSENVKISNNNQTGSVKKAFISQSQFRSQLNMQVRVLHDLSVRCRNSAGYDFLENLLKLSKRKYISIDYFSRMQNFCILFNAFKRPKIY